MEAVTAVLLQRQRETVSLKPMVTFSFVAHGAIIALMIVAPISIMSRAPEKPRVVMSISLGGGAPGPRAGGMTQLSARPIQTTAPAPELPKRAPITPPSAKAPEMVLPSKTAPTLPKNAVKNAPEDAKGRTATKGAETRSGSALAETGVKTNVMGFAGLATGGGGGTTGYIDVSNFCCPEYLTTMVDLIHRNWNSKQGVVTVNLLRYTIQRDGTITEVELETSSGNDMVDIASKRALLLTKKLPPLPSAFTNPTLTVHLSFRYGQ